MSNKHPLCGLNLALTQEMQKDVQIVVPLSRNIINSSSNQLHCSHSIWLQIKKKKYDDWVGFCRFKSTKIKATRAYK
uniref:Uncharacterized protein n=1 Tax=Romanomermis culicivorax TaxID=13658 RepID=A0A915IY91_ROMCU